MTVFHATDRFHAAAKLPKDFTFVGAPFCLRIAQNGCRLSCSLTTAVPRGMVRMGFGSQQHYGLQWEGGPAPAFLLQQPEDGARIQVDTEFRPHDLTAADVALIANACTCSMNAAPEKRVALLEQAVGLALPQEVDAKLRQHLLDLWWPLNCDRLNEMVRKFVYDSHEAEDIVSAAQIEIREKDKIGKFDPHVANLWAFLSACVRNFAYDLIRRDVRTRLPVEVDADQLPCEGDPPPQKVDQGEQDENSRSRWQRYTKCVSDLLSVESFPPSVRSAVQWLMKASENLLPQDLDHMCRLVSGILQYNQYNEENDATQVHRKQIVAYCLREVLCIQIPTIEELSCNAGLRKEWAAHWLPLDEQRPGNLTRWVGGFQHLVATEYFCSCVSAMRPSLSSWDCSRPFPDTLLLVLRSICPPNDDEKIYLNRVIGYIGDSGIDFAHKLAFALMSLLGKTSSEASKSALWQQPSPNSRDVQKWNQYAIESIMNKHFGENR